MRYISEVPLVEVLFALPESVSLANLILKFGDNTRQLIACDTCFNVFRNGMFVTFIVIRNTLLKEEPILMVGGFAHERKYSESHEKFWNFLAKELKFSDDVLIATDQESAIRSGCQEALRKKNKKNRLVNCTNHIRKCCERWLKKFKKEQRKRKLSTASI